jgi:hypothetical protein
VPKGKPNPTASPWKNVASMAAEATRCRRLEGARVVASDAELIAAAIAEGRVRRFPACYGAPSSAAVPPDPSTSMPQRKRPQGRSKPR